MTLKQWVDESPLTVDQIAKALTVHRVTLHRYMAFRRRPSPAVSLRLEKLSGGAVTCSTLARDFEAACP